MNSHSDKPSKLIKARNRLGRRGEGRRLGGEKQPRRSSLHRFGTGKKSKPRAAHAPAEIQVQTRAPFSPQPSPDHTHRGGFPWACWYVHHGHPPQWQSRCYHQALGWEATALPSPLHQPQEKGLKMDGSSSGSSEQSRGSVFKPRGSFEEFCHLPHVIRMGSAGSSLGLGPTRAEHGTSWSYRCILSISKGPSLSPL